MSEVSTADIRRRPTPKTARRRLWPSCWRCSTLSVSRTTSSVACRPRTAGSASSAARCWARRWSRPRRTVEERICHSLHAYFLRPGDPRVPIVYEVDRSRDGQSFTARRVVAIQHGKPIFTMSASFQVPEHGLEHQSSMPDVPDPDSLKSEHEWRNEILNDIPEHIRPWFLRPRPIEFRPVDPVNRFAETQAPAASGAVVSRGRPAARRDGAASMRRRLCLRHDVARHLAAAARADAVYGHASDREPRSRHVVSPARSAPTNGCSMFRKAPARRARAASIAARSIAATACSSHRSRRKG